MTMDDATPVSTDTNTLGSYGSGGLKGSPFQYDFALRNSCCDKVTEPASAKEAEAEAGLDSIRHPYSPTRTP